MAMLSTLEGCKPVSGFGAAVLGACAAVGDVLSACLGEFEDDGLAPTGLNRAAAMHSLKNYVDGNEWYINNDSGVFNQIVRGYNVPQPSYLESKDGQRTWSFAGRQLISWGINPETYKVKAWFYPVQSFLAIWDNVYRNEPNFTPEERAAIAYYRWLATYFEPTNELDKNIYRYKLSTLKSFLACAGLQAGVRKVEAEEARSGAAAQAAQQASEAAAAYKAAMERQERQAAEAAADAAKAASNIQDETGKQNNVVDASNSSVLIPLAVAAAAALSFMG